MDDMQTEDANVIAATPAKLPDGETWGVRLMTDAEPGQLVQVQSRGGKAWTERLVERVSAHEQYGDRWSTAKVEDA